MNTLYYITYPGCCLFEGAIHWTCSQKAKLSGQHFGRNTLDLMFVPSSEPEFPTISPFFFSLSLYSIFVISAPASMPLTERSDNLMSLFDLIFDLDFAIRMLQIDF